MTDKAERYIFAKFGEEDINLGACLPPDFKNHTLKDILEEFERIVIAENFRETSNPRTKGFTLVDKDKAKIIGNFDNSFLEKTKGINIPNEEVRIETLDWHSEVKLTHIPTGTVIKCNDSRSQYRNREKAWKLLAEKLEKSEKNGK